MSDDPHVILVGSLGLHHRRQSDQLIHGKPVLLGQIRHADFGVILLLDSGLHDF